MTENKMIEFMEKSFGELPEEGQIFFGMLIIMLTVFAIWSLMEMAGKKRKWYRTTLSVILVVISVILLQGLADIIRSEEASLAATVLAEIVGRIPAISGVLILLVLGTAEYVTWKHEKRIPKSITSQSVKETMDARTDGICYASGDGQPILVNRQMNQICGKLFQTEILNLNHFWKALHQVKTSEMMEVVRTEPTLILHFSDTEVWDFRKKEVVMNGNIYQEVIAYDVSEEYQLNQELKFRNIRLNQVNERLMKFNEEVEEVTRQKEMLDAKMKVHDDLGRALIALRVYLAEPKNQKNREELLAMWNYIVTSMEYEAGEKESGQTFEELKKMAHSMGVEIILDGEMPESEKEQQILYMLLREGLNNMLKHAGGHRLYLEIREQKESLRIRLTNDGKVPEHKIVEKGGLKNLRSMVELAGGTFYVESFPAFAIYVNLMREKK